jgi:type I restriction enzyme M protein
LIDAGEYKQYIFPLLFLKRISDIFDEEYALALEESGGDINFASYAENHRFQIPAGAHWRDVHETSTNLGSAIQKAMRATETENPKVLYGVFGDAQWTNKERLPDSTLRDLLDHFNSVTLSLSNIPEDEMGVCYEFLIKKFADDSGHTAAEFYTNRTVVHLMTVMLEPQERESIYDPTCGSGGMLLSCAVEVKRQGKEWRNLRLFGQERNLLTSAIARMNLFLHGFEDFNIVRGDTLADPKFAEGDRLRQFDLILANPPYSIKQWDRTKWTSDPYGRNAYGTPPQGRADYAFWGHILASLKPNTGRCAILFPHGVLFRDEERSMREMIVKADLIECVLGLGPNLFYNSPMEACVVICRTHKPAERRGKILFIDAKKEVTRERAQSFLTDDHIEKVVSAYRRFGDVDGFASVATVDEIAVNGYNLNLPLYVRNGPNGGDENEPMLAEVIEDWEASALALRESMSELFIVLDASPPTFLQASVEANEEAELTPAFTPIGEDRSEWRKVKFGEVASCPNESERNPLEKGLNRLVGLEHIDPEDLRIKRWGDVAEGTSFTRVFHERQVLFGKRRAYQRKVAVADFDGICSSDILVFEAKPDVLLPDLLPFIAQSEGFFQHALGTSAGSMSPRTKWSELAAFEFSLPPMEDQRRIAELMWGIEKLSIAWRRSDENIEGVKSSYSTQINPISDNRDNDRFFQSLGMVADITYGLTLNSLRQSLPIKKPYLRVANVQRDMIDLNEVKEIGCTEDEMAKFTLSVGDVLVVEGHAVSSEIGRAAMWRGNGEIMLHQNHILRARCHASLLPEYLLLQLNGENGRAYFSKQAKSTSGLNTINSRVLKEFPVIVPDLAVQRQMVREMEIIKKCREMVISHLQSVKYMKDHLLNRMLWNGSHELQ